MSATYRIFTNVMFICSFFALCAGQQEESKRWTREQLEHYLQQEQHGDLGEATKQFVAITLSGGCLRSTINRVGELLQARLNQSGSYAHEKTIVKGLIESSARLRIDHAMSLDKNFFYQEGCAEGTIMHFAAYTGNHPLIESIMKACASQARALTDKVGNSPIHLAVMAKRADTVELLLRLGFSKDVFNSDKQLPIDFVSSKKTETNRRLRQLLCDTITCDEMQQKPLSNSYYQRVVLPGAQTKPPVLCSSNKKRGNSQTSCLLSFLRCMSMSVDTE